MTRMNGNAYCHCVVHPTTHIHCRADAHGNVLPFVRCGCRRASSRDAPAWAGEHRTDALRHARRHLDLTDRRFQRFASDRRVVHRRSHERGARERDRRRDAGR
ncbi:MAG: hypothetical protein ACRD1P_05125 [Thermoanaerobaculia bacterium]